MIISIDPGVTNCGVSRMEKKGNKFYVHETINIVGTRKLRGDVGLIGERYDERTGRVMRIVETITEILDKYPEIDTIALEGPFFNPRMPNAYMSLLEVVFTIKYKIAVPRDLDVVIIAPMEVKFHWTGKGNVKGKKPMEDTLHEKIKSKEVIMDLKDKKLTEHEVDSIAVGFSHYVIKENENEKKK